MKNLNFQQRKYLESLLGKLWWIENHSERNDDIFQDIKTQSGDTVRIILEILHNDMYHEMYSEWINSLETIYKLLTDAEKSIIESMNIKYAIEYLNKRTK